MAYEDSTAGETYELFGPREWSKKEIADRITELILKERAHFNLPKPILKNMAKAFQYIWWPTYCVDEIEREFINQKIDKTAKTFKDLGIQPSELEDLLFSQVRDYRYVTRYISDSTANM